MLLCCGLLGRLRGCLKGLEGSGAEKNVLPLFAGAHVCCATCVARRPGFCVVVPRSLSTPWGPHQTSYTNSSQLQRRLNSGNCNQCYEYGVSDLCGQTAGAETRRCQERVDRATRQGEGAVVRAYAIVISEIDMGKSSARSREVLTMSNQQRQHVGDSHAMEFSSPKNPTTVSRSWT